MSKPWRESYVGLEWAHPARKHYREAHDGMDPWFMGSEAYRLIGQVCLCVFAVVFLVRSFLVSIPAVILMGIVMSSLFGLTLMLYTRDDGFERSIKRVEEFLRLTNGERFATTKWETLQELACADLKEQIRLWHTQVLRCANGHPLHGTAEDAEIYRQDIKRRYCLFASLGLVPPVSSQEGQDMLYSMSYIGHANAVQAATRLSPVGPIR